MREEIETFLALDDPWQRPVSRRCWHLGRGILLPRIDVVIGGTMMVCTGLAALALALIQSRMSRLGPLDLVFLVLLGVFFSLRRAMPEVSAVLVTALWFIGYRIAPHSASNWVSMLVYFWSYFSLMAWSRSRRLAWGVMGGILVVIIGWVVADVAVFRAVSDVLREATPDEPVSGPRIMAVVVTLLLENLAFVIGSVLTGHMSWTRARDLASVRSQARTIEQQQSRLAEQAVLDERLRISREIHDSVAHHVSVIGIQAAGARRALDVDLELAREALSVVESESRQAVTEMRSLVGALRSDEEHRAAEGLEDIDQLCAQPRRAEVTLLRTGDATTVGPLLGHTCYRVVQEALNNVERHSTATRVTVAVRCWPEAVEVEVTDNGRALGGRHEGSGVGLVGMSERVEARRGTLEAGPRRVGGWRVRAVMPLDEARADEDATRRAGLAGNEHPGLARHDEEVAG